jgi:glycosyltransferase involved in cell wall biosynthesis
MSDISIVLTIHDPEEVFESFLREALSTIKNQSKRPAEVLISGNSKPSYLEDILEEYREFYTLKFFLNESNSTTSNLNAIIPFSSSAITKILFMDDFFIDNQALQEIENKFNDSDLIWLASGSKNYADVSKRFVRTIRPKLTKGIIEGINTIGCPSVISFRTDKFLPFNEDTAWMLDCEWYLRMTHHYGKPGYIASPQIASRLHPGQASHWEMLRHEQECQLVKSLHNYSLISPYQKWRGVKCKCLLSEVSKSGY